MRSTKELIKKDVLMPDGTDNDQDRKINDSVHPTVLSSSQNHAMPVKHNVFLWNLPDVVESLSVPSFLYVSYSPLVSMKKEKRKTYRCGQRTVRLADCGSQSQAVFARRRSELKLKLLTCEHLRETGERTTEVREQALPSAYHRQTYLLE
ncbi:hypothetical protein TNCV_4882511 [Trichonephila clavipes]|nr:hypothetical protein TNCV_4882511 [Trichonephila clavipes]